MNNTGSVAVSTLPTPVRALKGKRISFISTSTNHSAAIDVGGKLYTMGCNTDGQLGTQLH